MRISKLENCQSFEARIKINKTKLESKILKNAGSSSVAGGSSTALSGTASGADMIVHNSNSAVPFMQQSFSLFDQFAQFGHKMADEFLKNFHMHDGYDASFFSTSLSGSGTITYAQGMNTIIKGIEKNYKSKIPT